LPVAYFGDVFAWGKDNFRLMKIMVSIMDKDPIDLERIKINANDFEEWDYLNPDFESEALGRVR
jgi:hypothetical protein